MGDLYILNICNLEIRQASFFNSIHLSFEFRIYSAEKVRA